MAKVEAHYHIEWRREAESDLLNIIDCIAKDDPAKAETFGRKLRNKVWKLAQFPKIGRVSQRDLRVVGVRELVIHRNYIIFYHILNDTNTVEILRIKHAARQMP